MYVPDVDAQWAEYQNKRRDTYSMFIKQRLRERIGELHHQKDDEIFINRIRDENSLQDVSIDQMSKFCDHKRVAFETGVRHQHNTVIHKLRA